MLSPLTDRALNEIKSSVDAKLQQGARSIEIYTQSDTLRCGGESLVGGQLPSQVPGCATLMDTPMNSAHMNIFGDQFNQVWGTDLWGSFMQWIKQVKVPGTEITVPVNIFLYPTQLFKNPVMDELL